jgi:drug/metabolite transporter (DMT)-like permease
MFLIIILYGLFGASFPISKILLGYIDPIFYTGIRMFIAGGILLIYQYFYAHHSFHFKLKHWWLYTQVILLGVYLTYILRFWGLDELTAAKTSFLFNVAPFFSALYSYLIFREKLTKQQWIGLTLGFIGFAPLLIQRSPGENIFGQFLFFSWPELAVLAAVACHSYSWIVMRKLVRDKSYAPAMVNGVTMFIGGSMALITSFMFEGKQTIENPTSFIFWLALVIIISNIICHNLYGHLLRKYTATFLAFAGFLGPLFSAFYSWVFLSEKITWHFFASAVVVFIGLYMFYKHELEITGIAKKA